MRRREFITGLSSAALWPLLAQAQQPVIPVVGFLNSQSAQDYQRQLAAFLDGLAEAGYVDDVGNGLEIFFNHPVFERLQLHRVVGGIVAVEREEIDLADGTPVGAHLRCDVGWERDLAEAFEDALAIPGIVGAVFENQLEIGQTE